MNTEQTTVSIDPFRLSMSVFAKTMDMARAESAKDLVLSWSADRPVIVVLDQKAGRYAKGKHYRVGIVYDQSVLDELDTFIESLMA